MSTPNTHFGAERIAEMLRSCQSIYFIGIGGVNMSSLAHLTRIRGYRVGGSDRSENEQTRRLAAEGIQVFYRHAAEQIREYDAVVYTVAISLENPEYQAAMARGIPCISRADYLGYLMTGYAKRIGIAGMHGKSSCTSMCAQVLLEAGVDPTVLSGAELTAMNGFYHVGGSEYFLLEACEYMDSFLDLTPTAAVILNIEMDHVDYFQSMEQIRSSYAQYAMLTGETGTVIYNRDDPEVCRAITDYPGRRISFGMTSEQADFLAVAPTCHKGRYSFDVLKKGEPFCHITLGVVGRHHIYNALACLAVCDWCGVSVPKICEGLSHFGGARRRMEWKGTFRGADVYDDYGHHPTEIRATLAGAKALCEGEGRLFCVYQPHTYSRTAALFGQFTQAFADADRVIMTDIYAAREANTMGVHSQKLAEAVGKQAVYADSLPSAVDILKQEVRPHDVIVVMGAGDIYRLFALLEPKREEEREENGL